MFSSSDWLAAFISSDDWLCGRRIECTWLALYVAWMEVNVTAKDRRQDFPNSQHHLKQDTGEKDNGKGEGAESVLDRQF